MTEHETKPEQQPPSPPKEDVLDKLPSPDGNDASLLNLALHSLETTSKLTEHQDAKATAVLRGSAFLAALAGGGFAVFFPKTATGGTMSVVSAFKYMPCLEALVFTLWCLAFFAYVVLVGWGAYLVLKALKIKFNIREKWKTQQVDRPHSLIFAFLIGSMDKAAWEKYWAEHHSKIPHVYLKHAVDEIHAVSEKLVTKVGELNEGFDKLLLAAKVFVAWAILLALRVLLF
ncbi:MAG: hypothetical protein KF696_01190 [Planctomycetes bacterium]|nr:hypothetical protein [Planctomycetota bacterium]MCW8134446.1 hypothetical protein [Planctomycetota bacterium]